MIPIQHLLEMKTIVMITNLIFPIGVAMLKDFVNKSIVDDDRSKQKQARNDMW